MCEVKAKTQAPLLHVPLPAVKVCTELPEHTGEGGGWVLQSVSVTPLLHAPPLQAPAEYTRCTVPEIQVAAGVPHVVSTNGAPPQVPPLHVPGPE